MVGIIYILINMYIFKSAQPDQIQDFDPTKKPDCLSNRVSSCDPVGIRTPNLRIRSAMLYPVELQGRLHAIAGNWGAKIDRLSPPPNPR